MRCANLEHWLNVALLCRLIQYRTLFDIPLDRAAHISTLYRGILLDGVASLAHHVALVPGAVADAPAFTLAPNPTTNSRGFTMTCPLGMA